MSTGNIALAGAAELFALERASLNGSVLMWTPDGWRLAVSAFDPFAGAPMADEDPPHVRAVPTEVAAAAPSRPLRPCGTHAAWMRHTRYGEQPCEQCEKAERLYRAVMNRRRYERKKSTAVHTPVLCSPAGSPMLVSVAGQQESGREPCTAASEVDAHAQDRCRLPKTGLTA